MRPSDLTALPLAERLQTMEALWNTLDEGVAQAVALPDWHEPVVQERLAQLRNGQLSTVGLDEAFDNIAHDIAARRHPSRKPA